MTNTLTALTIGLLLALYIWRHDSPARQVRYARKASNKQDLTRYPFYVGQAGQYQKCKDRRWLQPARYPAFCYLIITPGLMLTLLTTPQVGTIGTIVYWGALAYYERTHQLAKAQARQYLEQRFNELLHS